MLKINDVYIVIVINIHCLIFLILKMHYIAENMPMTTWLTSCVSDAYTQDVPHQHHLANSTPLEIDAPNTNVLMTSKRQIPNATSAIRWPSTVLPESPCPPTAKIICKMASTNFDRSHVPTAVRSTPSTNRSPCAMGVCRLSPQCGRRRRSWLSNSYLTITTCHM